MGKKGGASTGFRPKKVLFLVVESGQKYTGWGCFLYWVGVFLGVKRRLFQATTKTEKRGDATFFRVEVAVTVLRKFGPTYA